MSSRWPRTYAIATWTLIVVFAFLTVAHVVLTVLYFAGVRDTGVGYVLSFEWPAWIITLLDAAAVGLLWSGYRASVMAPGRGLALTSVASVIMVARALRMVLVPVCVALTMVGAIGRFRASRRVATPPHA